MLHFHRPEDEKRMVIILAESDYGEWLSCPVEDAPRYFRRWEGPLDAYAAPLAPRTPKAAKVKAPKPGGSDPDSMF